MRGEDEVRDSILTRRRLLQSAGGFIAAAAFPGARAASALPVSQASRGVPAKAAADITGRLARHMMDARNLSLPPQVAREGKHRILDTLGAMVSGARLKPGEMAIQ